MTWSISQSGKKEEVRKSLDELTFDHLGDQEEKQEAFAIRDAVQTLINATTATDVSVSASGSKGGSVSLSFSRWGVAAAAPPDSGG